ncbi:MAG: methyltransferase domain-containing protein [Candidatus Margulisbacteria bacterium]|nr:methyltransferase domain-containing protein [Candidatus Margulisiibacteriota bacterium]
MNNQEQFWKIRSEGYNNLHWVNESSYIQTFLSATEFNKQDTVLDVGTGTGVVAHAVAPLVKEVIGLDISQDMLKHSNWQDNKYFVKRDIRDRFFHENIFDKITARMVFHHILEDTQKAMNECYYLLKKGGKIILSEGIPPVPEVKKEYIDIFRLKEERLTFLEEDLIKLMEKSGFKNINVFTHIMKNFSVKNWLENSGLIQEKQDKIFEMHVTASDIFKKAYNLKILNGDCLIDVKSLIIVGEK